MRVLILLSLLPLLLSAQEFEEEVFFPFQQEEDSETSEGIDFFSIIPVAPKELEITNDGIFEYLHDENKLLYKENVVVKGDTGIQIFADQALVDLERKTVTGTGKVSVYNGPYLFKGDQVVYQYVDRRLDTSSLKTGFDPFLIEARRFRNIEKDGVDVLVAEDASVTTDDYLNPSFRIKADKISVYPDEMVIFKDMKIKLGNTSVLWLPYLVQSLDSQLGYHFAPGWQTNLGLYWRNRYGMHIGGERDPDTGRQTNPTHLMQLHVDPMHRRGLGLGVDLDRILDKGDQEFGKYSAYWIYDLDPHIKRTASSREGLVDKNRYKLELYDRRDWNDILDGYLRFDTHLNLLSDAFFLEDYYESEYRRGPQPNNFLSLTHERGNYLTNLNAQFQLNSFYQTSTRLPEFSVDRMRSPLYNTPLLYESQSSVGYLRESIADQEKDSLRNEALSATPTRVDEINSILKERGYLRAHTWHELSLPMSPREGVSITPRAGLGYTYYDQNGGISDGRSIAHAGLDIGLKLHRQYPDAKVEQLGLDGINHVIQPYLSLSHLEVSNLGQSPDNLVDNLTPITRPRPIHVGRYSALDILDDWSLLRMGVRQTFLTKLEGSPRRWLYWDTYIDFLLGEQDSANSFSNLYSEFKWSPLPWLRLNLETQFPVADSANDFREIYLGSTFMMGKSTQVSLGYGYLNNHPIVRDSNQVSYKIYHRWDDQWGFGLNHRWQFDDSTLELQSYSIHRNLKSWILSTEVYRRNYRVADEWGVSFGFTLRDFPQISLPLSIKSQ